MATLKAIAPAIQANQMKAHTWFVAESPEVSP
jgi:hypothetical protein